MDVILKKKRRGWIRVEGADINGVSISATVYTNVGSRNFSTLWLGHLDKPSWRRRGRRRKGMASLYGGFDGKLGMSQSECKWLLGVTRVEGITGS